MPYIATLIVEAVCWGPCLQIENNNNNNNNNNNKDFY